MIRLLERMFYALQFQVGIYSLHLASVRMGTESIEGRIRHLTNDELATYFKWLPSKGLDPAILRKHRATPASRPEMTPFNFIHDTEEYSLYAVFKFGTDTGIRISIGPKYHSSIDPTVLVERDFASRVRAFNLSGMVWTGAPRFLASYSPRNVASYVLAWRNNWKSTPH